MIREPFINILSVAGSDSSGGAGIQADIKTCGAFGVYASTVVTAVTAQSFTRVFSVNKIPADLIRQQLESVFESMTPLAIKTGMLPSARCIETIVNFLSDKTYSGPIVVDPVIFASAGDSLSGDSSDTAKAMAEILFPHATFVTPNIKEAEFFLKKSLHDYETQDDMAIDFCREFGCKRVVLKGGHASGLQSTDVLAVRNHDNDHTIRRFSAERIPGVDRHGTGCTFSTALACALALGHLPEEAVETAKDFVFDALSGSLRFEFDKRHGPLDFFPEHQTFPNHLNIKNITPI